MSLPEFQLLQPRNLSEAVEFLARHGAEMQILAGGTDLIPSLKQRLFTPRYVADIRRLPELAGIRRTDGGIRIGALTPLAEIEADPLLLREYPVLCKAAASVASPVLRNMGTIGGNVCLDTRCLWYNQSLVWRKSCGFCIKKDGDLCHVAPGGTKCWATFSGDTPPALLCLEAELEIAGPKGTRRVALRNFYGNDGIAYLGLGKDEILAAVHLPASRAGYAGTYRKLRVRGSIDYPLAGVAVAVKKNGATVTDAAVAITAVNPAPTLVAAATAALRGRELSAELADAVGALASDAARPFTTAVLTPQYRKDMIRVLTKRALLSVA